MTLRLPGNRPITYISGGSGAILHLLVLYLAGHLSRPWGRRGLHRFAWMLGAQAFTRAHYVDIEMPRRYLLRIYLADGYWIRLLFANHDYEPEIALILRRCRPLGALCFIDGGANLGYWALFAAHTLKQHSPIVAVEPAPHSFKRLEENCSINKESIKCLNLAVWSTEGETLSFASDIDWHGSAHILAKGEVRSGTLRDVSQVRTITVDSIVRSIAFCPLIILKLDVEGAERQALSGASRTLRERDTLIIYEDHGKDPECRVSAYLFELRMLVFGIVDGRPHFYGSVDQIRETKVNPCRGYNFFACKENSEFLSTLVSD